MKQVSASSSRYNYFRSIKYCFKLIIGLLMQGTKKIKTSTPSAEIPQSIWINLVNRQNESVGRTDVPLDAGPKEFQDILNRLLPAGTEEEEYNFFYNTKQIKNKLKIFFQQICFTSYEDTLDIVYHPVATFKVKPITRASSSMYGHTEAVLSMQFSPDSRNLASGSGDGTLRLWDIFTQTPLKQVKADNWVMIVQWAPDGSKVAFADKSGNITIYKIEQEQETKLNGHTKFVTSLAWQPLHLNSSVNRLISSSKDFTIRLWNADSGVCERSFGNHSKSVTKLLWSGSDEIFSCSEDQKISVYDTNGNFSRGLKNHSHWVNTMSLSTQHVLRRGCFDPEHKIKVEGDDKQQAALRLYEQATRNKKERLVTGSDDFTLMLFENPDKKPVKQMTGHQQPVMHVQFSPDSRYIISGSLDKSIKLWDGYTGEYMWTFRGHVGAVYQISWSTDCRYLVSASKDSTLKLWDIKTRKLMKDLPGHADEIYALDWSADGEKVATGGKDRQVKLWMN